MTTFNLSTEQYEALISLARRGADTPDRKRDLEAFLRVIEKANGIVRYALWIQWQEMDQPLPPTTSFPDVWPPELRYYLEFLTRPINKTDVDEVLRKKARRPTNVMVTPDVGAVLGWTKYEDFFVR